MRNDYPRRLSRSVSLVIMATIASLLTLPVRAASAATSKDARPMVMIILDTSGSMSYVQGDTAIPSCTTDAVKDTNLTYTFSRDMIAKEVLTGTFKNFWCRERIRPVGRYDHGYPIPWVTPEWDSQSLDGIIDTRAEDYKFALLTFDTVLGAGIDQTGGWSLGPNAQAIPGVGLTNLGLQNESALAGKLVIPDTSTEGLTATRADNAIVQAEILASIPFGGTPIAPSLQDAVWLLDNHPRLVKKTTTNSGDPYASCRKRNVLLITDGKPNMGEGELGYSSSIAAATELFKRGIKVYVVGFNLPFGTSTIVHDIAKAGGTDKAEIATTSSDLRLALAKVLGKAAPGINSRTRTVATNTTNSAVELQYQVNAAYSSAKWSDNDERGYFEVTTYSCIQECRDPAGGAGACEVFDAGAVLDARTKERRIMFTANGKLYPLKKATAVLTPDMLGVPATGELRRITSVSKNLGAYEEAQASTGYDATKPSDRALYRDWLIEFVRADKTSRVRRKEDRLGGVKNSNPVIQTNLAGLDVPIPSFKEYQIQQAARPTIAYTMTNDGFVHAFHLSRPATTAHKWLEELWAISPEKLTRKMNRLVDNGHTYLGNGELVLKDILLRKTAATTAVSDEVKLWRSVLVVPYREGGRGLFAIDVTDPINPFVRWEIDNRRHCWLNESSNAYECKPWDDSDAHDFSRLGYVYGKPKVGTIYIKNTVTNKNEEVAAAFFSCGEAAEGEPESGKCFQVVRLDTGAKIKEFRNGDGSIKDNNPATDNATDTLDFPVVGEPAAYNTFVGSFVTRVFVGDKGGQLWRVDTSSTDTTKWKMTFFFDPYYNLSSEKLSSKKRSAMRAAPAMSPVPRRGQLVLVFGMGDLAPKADKKVRNIVYSVREIQSGSTISAQVNWKVEMAKQESLTAAPIIFNNVAYFTSYLQDTVDACQTGTGRIWGLEFLNKKADGSPIGRFDKDGDATTVDYVKYIELANSKPVGLSLIARPSCVDGSGIGAAVAGGQSTSGGGKSSALRKAKPGKLELVVQTGATGQSSAGSKPGKAGAVSPSVRKIHQQLRSPTKQIIAVSWGQIQNL